MASSSSPSFLVVLLLFTIAATAKTSESLSAVFPRAIHLSALKQVLNTHKPKPKPKFPFKPQYFPQLLDHFTFTPKGSKIFYQKYLINTQYWSHGAPIFVYTGNEGDIDWFASNTGFLLDIAPTFRAMLVFIEHRFYGESMPFGNESYKSPETLGYLNSQQALADFAVLIRSLKQNLSSEASPVVVFGGSYGGMLAAWFRLKYPHVAIGALASSAPILQFDDITPWSSFYDAVSQDFKEASLNCYKVIKGSWAELEAMSAKKGGLAEVSRTFRTCKTDVLLVHHLDEDMETIYRSITHKLLSTHRDINSVYSARDWLWSAFVYSAMVNYPTKANFMMPLPAYPVEEMCKIIDRFPHGATKVSRAFAAASLYYNYSGTEKCFDLENGKDAHGLHGWDWQACTEMVMPMTCSDESMFPPSSFEYKEFADQCMKKYGVMPRPHWITTEFGGSRIEQVLKRSTSNIIFSNGMQDPWSRGSVLKNISASIVALVTKKGAHHVDFRFATKEDPDWLIEQRRQEVEIIQKWIHEYNADLKQE